MLNFITDMFYGVKPGFTGHMRDAAKLVVAPRGTFAGDNLAVFNRNLSFLEDAPFFASWAKHVESPAEKACIWRLAVTVWAARSAIARGVPGDFVECACYRGTTARIVCDTIDFGATGRKYYLYDLFEHDSSMPHGPMEKHSARLHADTVARFTDQPNVIVTQGKVPEVLHEVSPQVISLLHIDLNNADAEIGALDLLFDRVSPGAPIIFDDYGWLGYRKQKIAEDEWMAARGYHILELPTGQGLVIK